MNKVVDSAAQAVADIPDGATIAIGGFGLPGVPHNLINAVVEQGAKNLTIIGNDSGEWAPFAQSGQMRKLISGFATSLARPEITKLLARLVDEGKVEVDIVPHGTLEERLRAGATGIAAFYTPTGVGTKVAEGKEERLFGGKKYLLETALKTEFSLVKGYKGDRWGNLVCRLSALNRNLTMAMAGQITIAEVEEIVEVGELDPNRIDIPGIFVNRIVKATKVAQWIVRKVKE